MEDEVNLRRLVMKKAAAGTVGRPLISSQSPQLIPTTSVPVFTNSSHNYSSTGGHSNAHQDLDQFSGSRSNAIIENVGPDFTKLSKELNRVVLKIQHQSEVSTDCPMHNMDQSESRRGSRAHDFMRRRNQNSESADQENRRSLVISSSSQRTHSRTGSTEKLSNSRGSLIDHYYQSLPRKLNKDSHSKVDRRQSFQPQDYRQVRDKFVGKLEFKDTLRQLEREPRRPVRRGRQIGGSREYLGPPNSSASGSYGGSRDFLNTSGGGGGSGSRDYLGPPSSRDFYNSHPERNSGYLIESDFDFRSPPSTRDNSRDRSRISKYDNPQYAVPRRGQEQDLISRGREDPYASPRNHQYAKPQTSGISAHLEDSTYVGSSKNNANHYTSTSKGGVEETYAASPSRGRWDTSQGKKKELRIQINGESGKVYETSIRSPDYEPSMKDPLSPRRVEFADSVFSFRSQSGGQNNTSSRPGSRPESVAATSRPGSRPESPAPKSILRHTNSDNGGGSLGGIRGSVHHQAVRSNTSDLSFMNNSATVNRPTTLIIPTDGSPTFSTQHFNSQISIEHKNKADIYSSQSYNESEDNEMIATSEDKSDNNPHEGDKTADKLPEKSSGDRKKDRKDSSGSGVSFCHGGSSSKDGIHVPPVKIQVQDTSGENGGDSDGTVTDEQNHSKDDTQASADDKPMSSTPKKGRQIPPLLAEWNRSQSFPQGGDNSAKIIGDGRKVSDPTGLNPAFSLDSLNDATSEIDMYRSENLNLRSRIGDLEKVIVDNNVEIKCLKATLAECLRRIDDIETHIRHCPGKEDDEIVKRRPLSSAGVYTALEQQKGERRYFATRS